MSGMTTMPNGYSIATAHAINHANPKLLGVQLGRACLKNNISVTDVSNFFGVTRTTVYNWFKGSVVVSGKYADKMQKLLIKLA
jgi:DNA-binding transcriptional regulator YiaG